MEFNEEIDALFAADFGERRAETLEQYVCRRLTEGISGETLFGLAQILKLQEARDSIFLGSDSFGTPSEGRQVPKREWVTKKKGEDWKGKDFTELCPTGDQDALIPPDTIVRFPRTTVGQKHEVPRETKATQVELELSTRESQTPRLEVGVAHSQTDVQETRNSAVQASEMSKNQGTQTCEGNRKSLTDAVNITMSLPGTRMASPLRMETAEMQGAVKPDTLFRPREFAQDETVKRKRSISGRPKGSRTRETRRIPFTTSSSAQAYSRRSTGGQSGNGRVKRKS